MSSKEKMFSKGKRNGINNFLWYCSGLNLRDLTDHSNKANYFGIGGVNLFSSILITFIGAMSFNIGFPKIYLGISILVGIVTGIVVFSFNRYTINAISSCDPEVKNKRYTITLLPIILFAIFAGLVISTPLKFILFDVPVSNNFLKGFNELALVTDASISTKISSWSITLAIILTILLPVIIRLYTKSSSFHKNRSSILNEIMWFCAGANKEILRKCPTEYSKYFGIGGTILFTALMAMLSGGYAFYTAFEDTTLAICFGLFWGAMIFNLDRYIVNTIYTDGTVKITKGEILAGLPRIIIAIFLGIVISLPLELKLFEDAINARIGQMKLENIDTYKNLSESTFSNIVTNEKKIEALEIKKEKFQSAIDAAKKDWESIKKVAKTGKKYNNDTKEYETYVYYVWPNEYYTKKKDYQDIKQRNELDINDIRANIKKIGNTVASEETKKTGLEDANDKNITALNDLSTRMEAFSLLKSEKTTIMISSWFIMLLLIIIEIAPVLFKLMTESGPYDDILNAEKHKTKVFELKRISDMNDEINTEVTISTQKNQNRFNAEIKANEELLNSIAMAQAEIAKVAIEKWKEKELEKAISNPESFIQTNSK